MKFDRISIAASSVALGFALGYVAAKRALEQSYQDMLDSEIDDVKAHYNKLSEEDLNQVFELRSAFGEANKRADEAAAALALYQTGSPEQTDVLESIGTAEETVDTPLYGGLNLLHPDVQLDQPVEEPEIPRSRSYVDKSKPYVISVEDFMQNEKEFIQTTYTYYEGDDTLCGEIDEPVDDNARLMLVGTHLSDFGQMSDDPNTVYIRNLPLKMDIEVVRSQGKYSEEVAGLGGHE